MKCFSCNQDIVSDGIPYGYAHQHIGFSRIFPDLRITFCNHCEIAQVNHQLIDQEKLNDYYFHCYRKNRLEEDNDTEYSKRYFAARGRSQARLIKKYLGKKKVERVFEYGAGYGYNLVEIAKLFPKADLYTNEIDKTIEKLREFKQHQSGLQYDIIIMSHVLEHLLKPQEIMQSMVDCLSTDGLLFIEVPNEQVKVLRAVEQIEPHIIFFNLNSLKNFIKKYSNNKLEIVYYGTAGLEQADSNNPIKINLLFRAFHSLHYRTRRCVKWILNGGHHLPEFDFNNDTIEDIWNTIRVVCRKV